MTIAERIYNLAPTEASEKVQAEMKGWHIVYINVSSDSKKYWQTWNQKTSVIKFRKGGKISITNGWLNQDYNW